MDDLICNICNRRLQRFRSHEMVCYRCRKTVCRKCTSKNSVKTTLRARIICRKCEGAYVNF